MQVVHEVARAGVVGVPGDGPEGLRPRRTERAELGVSNRTLCATIIQKPSKYQR